MSRESGLCENDACVHVLMRGGMWHVRFNSDYSGYSGDFGTTTTVDTEANGGGQDGMGQSASFALGPYSAVIFSQ